MRESGEPSNVRITGIDTSSSDGVDVQYKKRKIGLKKEKTLDWSSTEGGRALESYKKASHLDREATYDDVRSLALQNTVDALSSSGFETSQRGEIPEGGFEVHAGINNADIFARGEGEKELIVGHSPSETRVVTGAEGRKLDNPILEESVVPSTETVKTAVEMLAQMPDGTKLWMHEGGRIETRAETEEELKAVTEIAQATVPGAAVERVHTPDGEPLSRVQIWLDGDERTSSPVKPHAADVVVSRPATETYHTLRSAVE